jgi:hypothetical protein
MYDTNGDPQYLVCVTIDITEQKIAQANWPTAKRNCKR